MYKKKAGIVLLFFALLLIVGCSPAHEEAEDSYILSDAVDTYELFIIPDNMDPDILADIQIGVESDELEAPLSVNAQISGGYIALVHNPGTYIVSLEHPAFKPVSAYVSIGEEKIYTVFIQMEPMDS